MCPHAAKSGEIRNVAVTAEAAKEREHRGAPRGQPLAPQVLLPRVQSGQSVGALSVQVVFTEPLLLHKPTCTRQHKFVACLTSSAGCKEGGLLPDAGGCSH